MSAPDTERSNLQAALLHGFAINLLNDDEPDVFAQQLLGWIKERGYRIVRAAPDTERVPPGLEDAMRMLPADEQEAQQPWGADCCYGNFDDAHRHGVSLGWAECRERVRAWAAQAGPPRLDVERLAKAMRVAWPTHREGSGGTGEAVAHSWEVLDPAYPSDDLAERIAATYARLGSQEGSE